MAAAQRWLYGPFIDLALGCGGLYLAVFAAFAVAGPELRSYWPAALTPILLIVISMPHYGGTLLRVYEQRNDRRAYALFSLWATLGVLAVFAWSTHDPYVGTLMFTVYLTWSPWHYTGQNYGVALLFLRRRGIEITPGTKRLIYTSFVASYAIAFLVIHSVHGHISVSPIDYIGAGIDFVPLGIPESWANVLVPAGVVVVLGTSLAWVIALSRQASLRELIPTLLTLGTQSLWFTVPMAIRQANLGTGIEPFDGYLVIRNYYFLIAIGHAIQYLWITSFYARTTSGGGRGDSLRYGAKVATSGIAVWTVPFLLMGPDTLGSIPSGDGLASLVAAAVNIHHFILDGAIWKLRSMRIAKVLIRREPEAVGPPEPVPASRWTRRLVWGASAAAVGVTVVSYLDEYVWLRNALDRNDAAEAARVIDRERWFGKETRRQRYRAGRAAVEAGDWELALAQFERSRELKDTAQAALEVARVQKRLGDAPAARRAVEDAVALSDLGAITRLSRDLLRAGDGDLALALLSRAVEIHPDEPLLYTWLGGVQRQQALEPESVASFRRALALDPANRSAAYNLSWALATSADASIRDPDEAIRVAEAARERVGVSDLGLADSLAAAYAAKGRFEDAARTLRTSLGAAGLAPEQTEAIRRRLDLYESGLGYLDPPVVRPASTVSQANSGS